MNKKLLIFIVTYNSSFRLKLILKKIQKIKRINCKILISDDCSDDDTSNYIPNQNKKIYININKSNLGYGGNIKKCINFAIKKKFDYAVMIHGDNQYNASYIPKLYKIISKNNADAVTGSRMKNFKSALNGKMPFYKFIGNYILTRIFNLYFDNQLRIQFVKSDKKIIEMPIKTYYRNEKSSFHVIYSIKYLIDIFFNKKL